MREIDTLEDRENRIAMLEEASKKINEAMELIEEATCQNCTVQAYTIAHLGNWANGGNPYDETIPKIINDINDGEYDSDEEN